MTSRKAVIFTILLFGTIFAAAGIFEKVLIPSPGAKGMNSQSDFDNLDAAMSRYAENVDISSHSGLIMPRRGMVHQSDTDKDVAGATGYYDQDLRKKVIAGVIKFTDSIYTCSTGTFNSGSPDSITFAAAKKWKWNSDTLVGLLRLTDTFGTVIKATIPNDLATQKRQIVNWNDYHDFVRFQDMLIHADGSGLPSVLSLKQLDDAADPDTTKYSPRWIDLSPARPGEPRVRVYDANTTTKLSGTYEYAYAFTEPVAVYHANNMANTIADTGYHSIVVSPQKQIVAIDGFLGAPYVLGDSSCMSKSKRASLIRLFRHKIDANQGKLSDSSLTLASNWKLVKTFWKGLDDQPMVIDSGQNPGDSTIADFPFYRGAGYGWMAANRKDTAETLAIHYEYPEAAGNVYPGWSWYDPITEIESPITARGRANEIVDSVDGPLWYGWYYSLPYLSRAQCPTDFVRIYRSVHNPDLTGADDGTVFYCELQIPVDLALNKWEGSVFFMGEVPDSMYANGPIAFSALSQAYRAVGQSDSFLCGTASPYTYDHEVDNGGEVLVRPILVAPNRIPFTDMEYSGSRLWGIGDPLYPQRLYYSGIDDINDWSAAYYLSMDENDNDELVAVEKLEISSGDLLLAWKHNSIFAITGTDPEYDLSVTRLTSEYGARDRWSVIKAGDMIFFMTSDEKIYAMTGDEPKYLSAPIQDLLDSTFTGDVRTYALKDKVNFYSKAKELAVSFSLTTGTWSVETYTVDLKPEGSFRYDTIQGKAGFDDNSWWVYENDAIRSFFWCEYDSLTDSGIAPFSVGHGNVFDFEYQTPFVGDGEWVVRAVGAKLTCSGVATKWVVADVYDQDNVKIATDSFSFGSGQDWAEQYFWFPPNSSRYFSVRLHGRFTAINNVEMYWTRLGRAPAR